MKMTKFLLFLALFFTLSFSVSAQDTKPKQTIKYAIRPIPGEKLVTAESAIKALCAFAKINNFSISEEVIKMPGEYISVSSSNLEVLFLIVQKVYKLEINKSTFEDDTLFYEFKKKK
jgi:hypothetical protein